MPPLLQRLARRLLLPVAVLVVAAPAPASLAADARSGSLDGSWGHRATAAPATSGFTVRLGPIVRASRRPGGGEVNPLAALPLYVERAGHPSAQANAWRGRRPADADLIGAIAQQPQAHWLGDWRRDVGAVAARRVAAARSAAALPVLVAYNVPDRDCGQHSSGGAASGAHYRRWIDALADGIGSAAAVVVLEPDGLAGLGCLSTAQRGMRLALLREAVARLSRLPEAAVYIDAGNPGWTSPAAMARRLRAIGVSSVRGFAVNVSGFETTARASAYGHAISRRTGGVPFVIDTSRNGLGPASPVEWCNPPGRALGARPTAQTGDPLIDAFLWVKRPGESDGTCNGGPPAGTWWPEYALGLAQRAAS